MYKEMEELGVKIGEKLNLNLAYKTKLLDMIKYSKWEQLSQEIMGLFIQTELKIPNELLNYEDENFYTNISSLICGIHNGSLQK